MADSDSDSDGIDLPSAQPDPWRNLLTNLAEDRYNADGSFLRQLSIEDHVDTRDDDRTLERSDSSVVEDNRRAYRYRRSLSPVADEAEPIIPDDSSSISPEAESAAQMREFCANIMAKDWDNMAPLLKQRGIDLNVEYRVQSDEITKLRRRLDKKELELRQSMTRPADTTPEESNRTVVQVYRNFVDSMLPTNLTVDHDGRERFLKAAQDWEVQMADEREDLFGYGPLEKIENFGTPSFPDGAEVQLALAIAAGWFTVPRSIKVADIHLLSATVSRRTPAIVLGWLAALLDLMVEDVAGEFVADDQMVNSSQALVLLHLLQFLTHNIRRNGDILWKNFSKVKGRIDVSTDPLVKALVGTLSDWWIRRTVSLSDWLRRAEHKYTTEGYDFIPSGSDVFIADNNGQIRFFPSAEYRIKYALDEGQWRLSVDSSVLGKTDFVLGALQASQGVNTIFSKQLEDQILPVKPPITDVCWEDTAADSPS